jgi:hypothetical protein
MNLYDIYNMIQSKVVTSIGTYTNDDVSAHIETLSYQDVAAGVSKKLIPHPCYLALRAALKHVEHPDELSDLIYQDITENVTEGLYADNMLEIDEQNIQGEIDDALNELMPSAITFTCNEDKSVTVDIHTRISIWQCEIEFTTNKNGTITKFGNYMENIQ